MTNSDFLAGQMDRCTLLIVVAEGICQRNGAWAIEEGSLQAVARDFLIAQFSDFIPEEENATKE